MSSFFDSSSYEYDGTVYLDADYSAQIKKNECIPTNKNEHCVCQELIDNGQGNGYCWIAEFASLIKT